MEENKILETEYQEPDTGIISGDDTPIINTSDQAETIDQEETDTSEPDAEESKEENRNVSNTEENGDERIDPVDTTEITTEPVHQPTTLESSVLISTYAALEKLATYVPTAYVDNSEPDINAEHLNNTEQGLLRVTNLLNGAVDVINDLQNTVANQANAIETLNSKTKDIIITKLFVLDPVLAPANEITRIEIPITTPDGYKPIGKINEGWGGKDMYLSQAKITTTSFVGYIANMYNSAETISPRVTILFLKTE